ncbi:MAG: DUF2231 domain-containing protein [Actinomycetota bacterium]
MRTIIRLLRGFRGHPAHPPLTDASIGAYTVATVAATLGWLGVEEAAMAKAAFVAIVIGLVVSVATILTGFVDYLRIRRGTPLWNTATVHWIVMALANGAFIASAALLDGGFHASRLEGGAALATLAGFALLLVGGWIGGAVTYVYGMRVINETEKRARDAILKPEYPPD